MAQSFWELFLLTVWIVLLMGYLTVLFQVIVDLFRDHDLSGFGKALWLIGLFVVPVLSLIAYILVRGRGMAGRQRDRFNQARSGTDRYIRHAAAVASPADQIADAKSLLDAGTITPDEFARRKAKALA